MPVLGKEAVYGYAVSQEWSSFNWTVIVSIPNFNMLKNPKSLNQTGLGFFRLSKMFHHSAEWGRILKHVFKLVMHTGIRTKRVAVRQAVTD